MLKFRDVDNAINLCLGNILMCGLIYLGDQHGLKTIIVNDILILVSNCLNYVTPLNIPLFIGNLAFRKLYIDSV